MNAANKTIQIQIRAFENVLKKRDAVALGKLYTTDAKFMNHGSPSTVGSSGGLNHFVTVDFNPPIETIILKKTPVGMAHVRDVPNLRMGNGNINHYKI